VSPTIPSWNQISEWLGQLSALQEGVYSEATEGGQNASYG